MFVSAGTGHGRERDPVEAEVGAETRAFVRRARTLGVPVRADLYPGGTHSWPYWQRDLQLGVGRHRADVARLRRALPLLLGAIQAGRPGEPR